MTSRPMLTLGFLMVASAGMCASQACGGGFGGYSTTTLTNGGGDGGSTSSGSTTSVTPGPSCSDGALNQDETDVDCGGDCAPCSDGKSCQVAADCKSGICDGSPKTCTASSCADQVKNGNESDVDCGGSCPSRCDMGQFCVVDSDCMTSFCRDDKVCDLTTCADTVKNGDETDTDCGGSCATGCGLGMRCSGDADCAGGYCNLAVVPAVCATPMCDDHVQDADETDVDCGGQKCPGCGTGMKCEVDADCVSKFCDFTLRCAAPLCSDGAKDGDETDIDCGGSCATKCGDSMRCLKNSDCLSGSCDTSSVTPICKPPGCSDGVKNGDETGADCGGSCPACAAGIPCLKNDDCSSKNCVANVCASPTCTDSILNGPESDVDCGGGACNPCVLTKHCQLDANCASHTCSDDGLCVCPPGMITVPQITNNAGGAYCIDAAEVTYTDYLVFYTGNPPTSQQIAACQWNVNYTPTGNWPPSALDVPVRYVNWCQAYGFCRYNNKRLCGLIATTAVPLTPATASVPPTDFNNATQDQWYNACSAQGVNDYPYGDTFDSSMCAWAGNGGAVGTTVQYPSCLGGVPGLLEMSGNVAEWEDSCYGTAGINDQCLVRGGSFLTTAPDQLRCDSGGTAQTQSRSYASQTIGFRCCL